MAFSSNEVKMLRGLGMNEGWIHSNDSEVQKLEFAGLCCFVSENNTAYSKALRFCLKSIGRSIYRGTPEYEQGLADILDEII